jgi:hypothetical protein
MTAKKATAPAEAEEVQSPEGAETGSEVETPAPAKGSVTVKFRGENGFDTERTFSKDVHGADFAKTAKEFSDNMAAQNRLVA